MSSQPFAISHILEVSRIIRAIHYVQLASFTFLIYDTIITFDAEIALIWNGKGRWGKILYYINRYFLLTEHWIAFIYVFYPGVNRDVITYVNVWAGAIWSIPVNLIMILRVVALWDRNKTVVRTVSIAFAAHLIVVITSIALMSRKTHFTETTLFQEIFGCTAYINSLAINGSTVSILPWASLATIDTIVFALTVIHALREDDWNVSRLSAILFRDSVVYFFIMVAESVAMIIVIALVSPHYPYLRFVLSPILRTSMIVLATRVMLNLRGVMANDPFADSEEFSRDLQHFASSGSSSLPPMTSTTDTATTFSDVLPPSAPALRTRVSGRTRSTTESSDTPLMGQKNRDSLLVTYGEGSRARDRSSVISEMTFADRDAIVEIGGAV